MELVSKNMNYIFNVEYFQGLDFENLKNEANKAKIKDSNDAIISFAFNKADSPLSACKQMEGYGSFSLYTLYPGLLVGIGNPHEIAVAGALKCGFTFDYVTGLPCITGSTLKGMLRAYFPGDSKDAKKNEELDSFIKELLGEGKEKIDVLALKEDMFVNHDIFLGAFPVLDTEMAILEMEYITSHKEKFKDPNPVSMVKVKPGVKFEFSFVMSDFKDKNSGKVMVTAAEKMALCKELLLLMGIGAKTNVGFGRFSEDMPQKNNLVSKQQPQNNGHNSKYLNNQKEKSQQLGKQVWQKESVKNNSPKCKTNGCNNKVKRKTDGTYYPFCPECSQKYRDSKGKQ